MAEESKIEWCHATFNPWRGCTKVSPGCAHCYAEAMSGRNPKVLGVWGPQGDRVVAAESYWRQPLKWNREAQAARERRRVFCASLADVFEGDETLPRKVVEDGRLRKARGRLLALIEQTPWLDWLLLTKRPQNVTPLLTQVRRDLALFPEWVEWPSLVTAMLADWLYPTKPKPPTNVWIGASVEDRQRADERIPLLLQAPAAVRFLSGEPLLGPLEFSDVSRRSDAAKQLGKQALDGIHWVIVGGESGPGARPCRVEWVRSVVKQCQAAGVPVFVKQLGADPRQASGEFTRPDPRYGAPVELAYRLPLKDRKGGDLTEWPEDLRIRQFPTTRTSA